jgi:hypothetical protein|tara:strand:- start:2999 stop:3208 length:210 start_codon:yes stop_codon:yes gene_type:complete
MSTLKEKLFKIYEDDKSKNALYNTLKLVGVTQKDEDVKRFLAEYKVWKQIKESKVKELREHEKNNTTNI